MTSPSIAPIRKQVVVEAPEERAFRVFTENFDAWWPREHHIGKAALAEAVLEPRVNGRWYERGVDGSECEWGKVLVWEPPRRLVLAWQINGAWQYDAGFVTELEITFTPDGPGRTRVDLEHRNLERFGEAATATRDMMDRGWENTLGLYAGAATQTA